MLVRKAEGLELEQDKNCAWLEDRNRDKTVRNHEELVLCAKGINRSTSGRDRSWLQGEKDGRKSKGGVVLPKIVEAGRMGSIVVDQHVGVSFDGIISREEDHPQEEEKGKKG